MDKIKITREEALRRWNSAKETKRRMVERLEALARESYKDQTGEYPVEVEDMRNRRWYAEDEEPSL